MRWSYTTIHYELKKEGILGSTFLDEPEIELSLNQYGKAGWELVSLLETRDGLIAVFKQPLGLEIRSSSPAESADRIRRAVKEPEKKSKVPASTITVKNDREPLDEEIAEAMLLDDFEVVEDHVEKADARPSAPPVDVGLIRIE